MPRLPGSSDCVDFVEDCEGEAGRLNRGLVGRLLPLGSLAPVRVKSSPSDGVEMKENSEGCLVEDDRVEEVNEEDMLSME